MKKVNDFLNNMFESTIEKAIQAEFDIQNEFKERFYLLKCKPLDALELKLFYTKYFNQHKISALEESLPDIHINICVKFTEYNDLRDKIVAQYCNLSNNVESVKKEFLKSKELQKENFIRLLKSVNARDIVPLIFLYNPTDFKSIDKLLSLNLSPDLIDPVTGETLLYSAVDCERYDIIRLLLSKGADPFAKNTDGQSAHKIASVDTKPQCLEIMLEFIQRQPLSDNDSKDASKELLDILNPVLNQAKQLLDRYGIKLQKRKSLSLFLRVLLHYNACIDERSEDYATYSEKLREAKRDVDIHVFFDEIVKKATSAKKGMLGNSSLHDPLAKLMETFLRDFDTHSFNELRRSKVTEQYASPNSDMIKMLKSKLERANQEIAYIQARNKIPVLERPASSASPSVRDKLSLF